MFRESGTSATFKSRTRNYEGTICASVRCRTYTRKSSERDARILRFQERTALLLPDLHPAHARLYTRGQQWLVGVLIFAGATLIPLGLTLLSSDLLFIFGAAMADKYWMDVFIRHESHPMVARLVPEVNPPETSFHSPRCQTSGPSLRNRKRALRSLPLRRPLVRGQLETSQVAEIAWRQTMLNSTFYQQADITRRGPAPEADPV